MKFSIVLSTTYERPHWWDQCIQSVVNQEHTDWELLVSTDANPPLPSDPRIILVRGQNRNLTRAMNLGMKAATGDVISWLGDDDFLLPHALDIMNAELGDFKWAYSWMLYHNVAYGTFSLWELMNVGNSMPHISTYFRRSTYLEVGECDESFPYAADYEYWLRLGTRYAPKLVPKITAYYRDHGAKMTHEQGGAIGAEADRIRSMYARKA